MNFLRTDAEMGGTPEKFPSQSLDASGLGDTSSKSMLTPEYNVTEHMTYFTFEHTGGADLHISSIEVKLSQACEPLIGPIARMAHTYEGSNTGFLGDIKDNVI